jgi:hypothetical protein
MCDVSCDITPLLTSFPSSKGPDVRRTVGVGHPGMVIGDVTYSPRLASLVGDSAELLLMPVSIAEQILVDSGAVTRGMPASFAPLASFVVLLGAMLPPIGKVFEASVKHGLRDIRGHRGIVKDAWLKAAEGISMGEGL